MYQHQHAPLSLERLKDVPQPVVVLLEKLLKKDPTLRFRTLNELLKAIPTIPDAIEAPRGISRQNLQKTPSTASRVETRKRPTRLGPKEISIARLPITGSDLFGREEDIAFLDDARTNQQVNVVTFTVFRGSTAPGSGSFRTAAIARIVFGPITRSPSTASAAIRSPALTSGSFPGSL
jgi:hypothetical protein